MAVRSGKPIMIQGTVDRIAYATDYQKPDIVSSICCPLLYGEEPVGVINISSKNPERVFTNSDEEFLVKLSQLTAEVIITSRDNASNLQSTYVLGLLNNVREIFSMKYRFEERLNLLLMKIANAFEAKECTYYEFNPLDRGFMAKASSSIGMSLLKERPMRLDDSFAQRVLKTGNTICVNATGKTHRSKKWCLLQPIRIGAGQDLAGTLFIYLHSEKNQLKEETVLLRKIGDMLARELSKNRDMEALKVQSLKYSAISQFSFDIANAKSLPDLTKMILSNVRLILESETCVLRLRNSPLDALHVYDSLSHKNAACLKEILVLDEAIASDMVPGKGALLIADLNHSTYEAERSTAESMLSVAIEINGEVLGTLSLYDKKSMDQSYGTAFSEEDKEILLNFGLQVCKGLKRFLPFTVPTPKESVLTD
jgi:GAF domain-containing protein